MKHYYSRSESLCGKSCSVSENVLSKDNISHRCGNPKNYNTYHLVIPNRAIQREKDRSQRSDDLYTWQKSNACKCRCSKSITRFAEKFDDSNFENPNWKCKQLDRDYIRKSLVSGLKDMGIRCLEDYNPKAEVFILANHSQSPFLTNSSMCPKPLHAYDVKKRQTNLSRPNLPYNCRSKKIKNIELELRYQAFKECIVGKLDRKYWKKNRPIDQQHMYKTLVKCGDLALQKYGEGTAESVKHCEINNIAVKDQIYVDGDLTDVENYEENIGKVKEDIQEASQRKATNTGTRPSLEFVISDDGEIISVAHEVLSMDSAQENRQQVNLATNEMDTDLSNVDTIENPNINNVVLQEGELNENLDIKDIDLVENSTMNIITSSHQDLPVLEGLKETNEAIENVEAIEYQEPDDEKHVERKIANLPKSRKNMEDPIQSDAAIIQKSHKPLPKNPNTYLGEEDDYKDNNRDSITDDSRNSVIDANWNPVIDANGNPVIDANGNPIIDANENPVIDANGNPVIDANGNPVIDENENPVTDDEEFLLGTIKKVDSSEEIFDSPFIDKNNIDEICNKITNVILSRMHLYDDCLNKLTDSLIFGEDGEFNINQLQHLNIKELLMMDEYGKGTSSSSVKTEDYLRVLEKKGKIPNLDTGADDAGQDYPKLLEQVLMNENSDENIEKENLGMKPNANLQGAIFPDKNFENYRNSFQKPDILVNESLLKSDLARNKDRNSVSSKDKEGNKRESQRGQNLETIDENRKNNEPNFQEFTISNDINETRKIDSKEKISHLRNKNDLRRGQKLEAINETKKNDGGNFQEFPISDGITETQKIDSKNKTNLQNRTKPYKEKTKESLASLRLRGSKQSNDDVNNRFVKFQGKNKVPGKSDVSSSRKQKLTTLNPNRNSRVQSLMKVYRPQNSSPKPDFVYGDFEKIKSSMSNLRVKNPCTWHRDFQKSNLQIQPTCILTYTLSPKKISHRSEFKLPVKSYCNLITNSTKCQPVNACFNRPSIPMCKSLNTPNYNRSKIANFVPTFTQKKVYDIPKLYGTTCLVKPQDYCLKSVQRCASKVR